MFSIFFIFFFLFVKLFLFSVRKLCSWIPRDALELSQEGSNDSFHIYSTLSWRITSHSQKINSAWSVGQLIDNVYCVWGKEGTEILGDILKSAWQVHFRTRIQGKYHSSFPCKLLAKGWPLEPGFGRITCNVLGGASLATKQYVYLGLHRGEDPLAPFLLSCTFAACITVLRFWGRKNEVCLSYRVNTLALERALYKHRRK